MWYNSRKYLLVLRQIGQWFARDLHNDVTCNVGCHCNDVLCTATFHRPPVMSTQRSQAEAVGREGTRFAVRAPIENSSIPGKQQQEYVERAAFFSLVPSKGRPDSFGNQPLFTMHYHQSVLCPATKQISAVTTVFDKQWRFKKAYLMSLIFKSNMQIDCSDHIWQHCPAQL